jgi:hypothetical protein
MTTKQVKQIIENYIAREQDAINEHDQIAAILKTVEGKEISGKVLTKKLLGENLRFKHEYSMYYIVGKYTHLIGYSGGGESVIAVEKTDYSRGFEYFDACQGNAARERIEKLNNIDQGAILKVFGDIEKTFNKLRTLFGDIERQELGSFNNPVYYDLLRSIYEQKDGHSQVKLTEFYFIRK